MAHFPPGPAQKYPGQHLIQFRRDPILFLRDLAARYGDLVHFKMGPQDIVLVNDPNVIKDVFVTHGHQFRKGRGLQRGKRLLGEGLLTSEDPLHLRQRRLMQPAFHRQRIEAYGVTMTECAQAACDRWQDGQTADVTQEMMRLTLAIVGKTLFDADLEAEAPEIGEAFTEVIHLFNVLMLPFSELLEKLPLPHVRRFAAVRDRLDATVYRMIAEHRAAGQDRGDLLSMLLMARDADADGTQMTDLQVRDEALTIFLAGHETTANALTWTWYLLSQNPEAAAQMQAELDSVLQGRVPTVSDLSALTYTRHVVAESMRLYPPAWVVGRQALSEVSLGDFVVPEGTILLLSQAVTHVDPRFWPAPMRFDPDRWTSESEAIRPKFAYFPFGGGSRICIGEQFAWMELILVLATVAQRWRLELCSDQKIALQPIITLRPKYGMRMVFHGWVG